MTEVKKLTVADFEPLLIGADMCLDDPGISSNDRQHQKLCDMEVSIVHLAVKNGNDLLERPLDHEKSVFASSSPSIQE